MISQPPLLDRTGESLPGPQFVPRPGWGGQLREWFTQNAYVIVFRFVILFALIIIGRSLWLHLPARNALFTPVPVATSQDLKGLTVIAKPGDGMTNLAARAIDLFVAVQSRVIRLDSTQHLFAVDSLARSTCWCALNVNQAVSFTTVNISAAIEGAQKLSGAQYVAWTRLLRR